MKRGLVWLLILGAFLLASSAASAQEKYTLVLRGVAIDRALQAFVDATGLALAYDPEILELRTVYCVAENREAEDLLRCILRDTELDYVRLSSGTYVVIHKAELPPSMGYVVGNVTDRDNGGPVPYAHVYLAENGIGTVTNEGGRFSLPPLLPGRYTMTVSHVAYRRWQDTLVVLPGRRVVSTASLAADPVWVEPIVVDGSEQRFPAAALNEASLDLAAEEQPLVSEPAGGATAALRTLSGVRVHDATADLHVQGGESGEHRYELDGIPLYLPQATIGFVGPFSPFALQRITVHKAGFGVEHGSQTSGVISLAHAIDGPDALDLMVDPESANGRLRRSVSMGPVRGTALAAVRIGLDAWSPAGRVSRLLERWGEPDAFLVFAPVDLSTDGLFSGEQTANLSPGLRLIDSKSNPTLEFSDVHLATRLRVGSLHSIYVSAYQGRNRLEGGLLNRNGSRYQSDFASPPPVTALDMYSWVNRGFQAQYEAILGNRLLFSSRFKSGRFALDHAYDVIDSLATYFDASKPLELVGTNHIADQNRVLDRSLSASLEWALERHQVQIGMEAEALSSRFNFLMAALPERFEFVPAERRSVPLTVVRGTVRDVTEQMRLSGFLRDRFALSRVVAIDGGIRLTHLPARGSLYAEPRAALNLSWSESPGTGLHLLTSGGLYRQYVNQFDVSALNAGALLPSVRVWLPVDETVSPPLALHLSQAVRWAPSEAWEFGAEAYFKRLENGRIFNYALPAADEEAPTWSLQSEFLAEAETRSRGGGLHAQWKSDAWRMRLATEWSNIERWSPSIFQGRTESVPWEEPVRLDAALDWHPSTALVCNARFQGVWGRSWGFRRAYYDYFGQRNETRVPQPGIDFGNPSADRLPPLAQLDLGTGYTHRVGPASLQLRLDVLNVLGRANVLDWRLYPDWGAVENGTGDIVWEKRDRTLYGRMVTGSVRLAF